MVVDVRIVTHSENNQLEGGTRNAKGMIETFFVVS